MTIEIKKGAQFKKIWEEIMGKELTQETKTSKMELVLAAEFAGGRMTEEEVRDQLEKIKLFNS